MNQPTDQPSLIEETGLATTGLTREKPMFEESSVSEEDMGLINRFASGRLQPEQVYVRSMFLCSSQPCISDGCQFVPSALQEIAERVVGLSVLTGHDRTSLPLARFYKANVVQRETDSQGEPVFFVRAWFYWLRETSGARDLLLNIDGGIYREVSLAWRYDSWRCSICHAPNGSCCHRVGAQYNGRICYRQIERITEVLEGSLVYKSADRNTYLAGARGVIQDSEEALLLIAEVGDPIYAVLERASAIQERFELQDVQESLSQSIDNLWIRCESPAFCEGMATQMLIAEGVCLGEIRSHPSEGNASDGELLHLTRSVSSPSGIQALPIQEVHHGAVRTI